MAEYPKRGVYSPGSTPFTSLSPASPNGGGSRSSRAFTLPSQAAAPQQRGADSNAKHHHHHHEHRISHRHHRSHQIECRAPQATPQASSSQLPDLLGPVRNVAGGLRELSSKNASSSTEPMFKFTESPRDKEKQKELQAARPHGTELDRYRESRYFSKLNEKQEKVLGDQFSTLVSKALTQGSSLAKTHADLTKAIGESSTLISSLSNMLGSTSQLLKSFTNKEAPELEESTRNQLLALERTYTMVEKDRLTALQGRLGKSRDKMDQLKSRLEECRKKVEREENRELEELRRHKRMMSLVWGAIGFALLVFVVLVFWARISQKVVPKTGIEELELLNERLRQKGLEGILEDRHRKQVLRVDEELLREIGLRFGPNGGFESLGETQSSTDGRPRETNSVLARLFDEL